jgi:DNA-binding transcriptional ArsR family regulator
VVRSIDPAAPRWASLLDVDPDLADGIPQDAMDEARRRAVASVIELEPPDWDPTEIAAVAGPGWLGLCLLDGLVIREVTVGRRPACELFGPGDVLRPWDSDGEYDPLPISVRWPVVERSRLAVLDAAFAARIAPWPSITSQIVGRIAQRARSLALSQAATHLPRAGARLLILFWLLAERWGAMTPDGVRITLPLTHEVLSMLVGTHRPTVTIALQRLARAGLLTREGHDRWLLSNAAIACLKEPEALRLIDGPGEEGAAADALVPGEPTDALEPGLARP